MMFEFFTVVILLATSVILWSLSSWFSYRHVPPGPRPWPIVGNIFLLRKKNLVSLAKEYGPIYTLWFGSRPFIVISGAELMHNALISQGDVFASRCQLYAGKQLTCNFRTVNTSEGDLWKTLRRNLISEVLSSTKVRSYKPVRDREFRILVDGFRDEARDNDGVVPVLTLVRRTLFNILSTMCFGERMEESVVREMDGIMDERFNCFRGGLANFFPILRLLDRRKKHYVKALIDRTEELLTPYLVKAREAMSKGEPVSGRYLEALLRLQEMMGRDSLTDSNIISLCAEVLNAGTDTTAYTAEWAISRIVSNPKVQRNLVEEMETVLGARAIEESDIERLPYLQAVVRESQRMDGSASALPHAVSEPNVQVKGYDIPMNAVVMFMISSVGQDANIWGDPHNFRPERFQSEMGASVDLRGTKEMTIIPFGAGKRICPAINLALLNIHMIVGTLVQNFELSNGRPGEVDLTPKAAQLKHMKVPLRARIRERQWPLSHSIAAAAGPGV